VRLAKIDAEASNPATVSAGRARSMGAVLISRPDGGP
jgi:hypothetical protein